MSTPDTTVVVVEERRRRLFVVPLIAAVVAAALLGTSTFALWTKYAGVDGGTIQAGNLDLTVGSTAYYDVSDDRADSLGGTQIVPGVFGHPITLGDADDASAWRIVPGDTVALVYDDVAITLEGDNMVASLSVTQKSGAQLNITGMTYTYAIYTRGAPTPLAQGTLGGAGTLLYLTTDEPDPGATGAGYDGVLDADGTEIHGVSSDNYTIVVYGTFTDTANQDPHATGALSAEQVDTLSGLAITLAQVRTVGGQFNPAP